MSQLNFFEAMPSFSRFERLSEAEFYVPAPDDWYLVISDIQGSTKAIEAGRYRDVNTLGAASISTVHEVLKNVSFPYVFGGDGATFLIPPEYIAVVKERLLRLKRLSQVQLGMSLRIGVIQVGEIHGAGEALDVAKFQICPGKCIALMRGGGLSWAESRIKGQPEHYCLPDGQMPPLEDLTGLSCRWQPLPARNGSMLSVLVAPTSLKMAGEVYGKVMKVMTLVFSGDLEAANPVRLESFKYKSFLQILRSEFHLNNNRLSRKFAKRVFEMLLCVWAFRLKLPAPFAAEDYLKSIPAHSDYRKLDDTLRMILDCTPGQAQQIRTHLDSLYTQGHVYYGIHESPSALMTCFVEHLGSGGHIHFIDGSDGGYAVAAQQMKKQMAAGKTKAA
jgi:hypothetical protein